jgi:GT2 family glycosyltransferase/glycosyltransferase involved in cell wall biosynthesis
MSTSIIIPVYNALQLARECVNSIYDAQTATPFEVLVVNNGSSPDVRAWLSLEEKRRPNFSALHFDQPLGFARATNVGALRAKHKFLVLLNSDTIVTDGWLDNLRRPLLIEPRLGIVSPVTNCAGNEVQTDPDARTIRPKHASRYAERVRNRRELIFDAQRLAFFCVMMPRALWERLSGLEESYGTGNFEDDDFCLRARLAGYRLGVARNAFVFHHQEATFRANDIDHELLMEQNQLLFCDRASIWSRHLDFSTRRGKPSCSSVSVVLPVAPGCAEGLRDSLASLANQTVTGFETLVVSSPDTQLASVLSSFNLGLKINSVKIADGLRDQPAAALNAGLEAATGDRIAYLPSGDIYYPFHIELLESALRNSRVKAAYTNWTRVDCAHGGEERSLTEASQLTADQLMLGDRAPVPGWMHSRDCLPRFLFDDSLQTFYGWEFLLRLKQQAKIQYIPRITWERRLHRNNDFPNSHRMSEALSVMKAFPATKASHSKQRARYLEAIKTGREEKSFLVTPSRRNSNIQSAKSSKALDPALRRAGKGAFNICLRISRNVYRSLVPLSVRHQIDKGARELLGLPPALYTNYQKLQHARDELRDSILAAARLASQSADILLFNIIEWEHLTQRPHHLARQLSSRGHRIFWIDVHFRPHSRLHSKASIREFEPGIFHVALPVAKGSIYTVKWTERILATMEIAIDQMRTRYCVENAIQLVHFPKWLPLVSRLRTRFSWPVVYDCLDDHKSFSSLYGLESAEFEDDLGRNCDLLVTCSHLVHDERRHLNRNTVLVPNGCDYDVFSSAVPGGLLAHLPRPIVGFFGAFADWLDFDWIEEAASRFPLWSFVYIGRPCFASATASRRWQKLSKAANIHVFPQALPNVLASYLSEFDVCTMPFQNLPMTRGMNPVKIYEYLAGGKPVVVPDFDEMLPLADKGLVSIYRDKAQSFELLEQMIHSFPASREVAARQAFAAENTWTRRAEKLAAHLAVLGNTNDRRFVPGHAEEQIYADCFDRNL